MQYELRHGDVWIDERHIVDGSGLMGVLIYNDPESSRILSHGNAKMIREKFDHYSVSALYDQVEALYFPVHLNIIRALNHSINCADSARHFKAFLAKFGEEHPELIPNEIAIADALA